MYIQDYQLNTQGSDICVCADMAGRSWYSVEDKICNIYKKASHRMYGMIPFLCFIKRE